MQHHLCRTLAHYAIYLASKLKLPICSSKETFVLDFAHSLWNKEGKYTWATGGKDSAVEEDDCLAEDSGLDDDFPLTDIEKWPLHLTEYYASQTNPPHHDRSASDFGTTSTPNVVVVDITTTEYYGLGSVINPGPYCALPLELPKLIGSLDLSCGHIEAVYSEQNWGCWAVWDMEGSFLV